MICEMSPWGFILFSVVVPAEAGVGIMTKVDELDQTISFRVGPTDDLIHGNIMASDSARLALERTPGVEVARCPGEKRTVKPEDLNEFDALLAGGCYVTRESVAGVERCTVIVRFGAGYDRVDVDACTDAGIILATTPGGIRRSMATAALTHILALNTRLFFKSKFVYNGRWPEAATIANCGTGFVGKTIGFVGFGNIGRDLYTLISPFEMRNLVHDPYLDDTVAGQYDVERVDLSTLMSQADFVVTVCTLTEETRHLIGEEELRLMKPSAYLINVARGAIIDQKALVQTLSEKRIAGAGLDAFDPEPIEPGDPLLTLDNVILTPHALGITDEMIRLCSEMCVDAALGVMRGKVPESVINRAVLDKPQLTAKLEAYRQRYGSDNLPSR